MCTPRRAGIGTGEPTAAATSTPQAISESTSADDARGDGHRQISRRGADDETDGGGTAPALALAGKRSGGGVVAGTASASILCSAAGRGPIRSPQARQ